MQSKDLLTVVRIGRLLLTPSSRWALSSALSRGVDATSSHSYGTLRVIRSNRQYSICNYPATSNIDLGHTLNVSSVSRAVTSISPVLGRTSARAMSGSRSREIPSATIIFRQLFEHKSYTYTYLLGCMKTRQAALIDPVIEMVPRDIRLIEQLGLNLKYAINTHVHADHITGSGKLKQLHHGSASVLGVDSGASADIYLDQGQTLSVGEIQIEARQTPGHTNGCMTYVWHDERRVFTGDAVLIRGCGRTDFQQGSPDKLYTSVQSQIFSLPDDYVIYPAHDYTGQPWTTVGEEKEHNPRLSKEREEFVKLMNNLKLPYPKQIDRALPANLMCGIVDEPAEDVPTG